MTDNRTAETKLTVGQQLWFVPNERRNNSQFVTVLKVGRKWADIGQQRRIDIKTLIADGGNFTSPGRCWINKEQHDAQVLLADIWNSFWHRMQRQHSPPDGITINQIQNARRALFKDSP